jgi:ABC-type multidrug transport system permease subunit
MTDHSHSAARTFPATLVAGLAWLLCYMACRYVLDSVTLPDWARIAVALFPAVPFIAFLVSMIGTVRSMDELHRRVHLEALAFAFPAGIALLMILGLLQLVIEFHPQRFNFRDAWSLLIVLYFGGLGWSWRRYK